MIILAQQNGAGPIVSINMGAGSAPSSLAEAPVVASAEAADQILISRNGILNTIPYAYFSGGIAGQQIAASPDATSAQAGDDMVLLRGGTTYLLPYDDLLAAIPSFMDGYPATGFWIGPDGSLQQVPTANMTMFTNPNLCLTLIASGMQI